MTFSKAFLDLLGGDVVATVYADANYQGQSQPLKLGGYNTGDLLLGNDRVSSVRVSPGYRVTLFEHQDYEGRNSVLTGDIPFLTDFNDQTSSIRVEKISPATVYVDNDYRGASQNLDAGDYDLGALTVGNDRVSSIRVSEGYRVTLFEHSGFAGRSSVFTSDNPALPSFNDSTSSIKVEKIVIVPTATVSIVSGNNQRRPLTPTSHGLDMAKFDPLVVKVMDAAGKAAVGEKVRWKINQPRNLAAQAMSDNGTSASIGWDIVASDAEGLARLQGGWPPMGVRAYHGEGSFTVTATSLGQTATFTLTVGGAPDLIGKISVVSGNNQSVRGSGARKAADFAPLTVRVTNMDGTPAPNVKLWIKHDGSSQTPQIVGFRSLNVSGPVTDVDGIATFSNMYSVDYTGPFTMTAIGDGLTPAVFQMAVLPE